MVSDGDEPVPDTPETLGGYAIQGLGAFMIARVEGSYTNVVGLPLAEVVDVLKRGGVIVPETV